MNGLRTQRPKSAFVMVFCPYRYRHHKDTDGDKGNEGNELDKASGKQDEVDSVWKSEIRQAELEAAVAAGAGPAGVPGLLSNGFSTKWGPEGFQKKKHPLAIMVRRQRPHRFCFTIMGI